jgi:hypothetical protein
LLVSPASSASTASFSWFRPTAWHSDYPVAKSLTIGIGRLADQKSVL